jgi:hypothetical protein
LKDKFRDLGLKAQSDTELLELLAQRYTTAHDAAAAITVMGVPMTHRTDLGARHDVLTSFPPE